MSLKDLVSQTLDARGVLPKIRAELRANVFLALEESNELSETYSSELSAFAKTTDGPVILNLVREFLEYFNLDFTLAVFNPESRCNIDYNEMTRQEMLKSVPGCENCTENMPLLCQLIKQGHRRNVVSKEDLNSQEAPSPLGLNSTYTKIHSLTNAPEQQEGGTQEPENQPTNSSGSSISEASPKDGLGNESDGDSSLDHSKSGMMTPIKETNESFNMLIFTPVQQVRTVPKDKTEDPTLKKKQEQNGGKQASGTEVNEDIAPKKSSTQDGLTNGGVRKDERSALSLNDLPPLTSSLPPVSKQKNMTEIRKMLETVDSDSNNTASSKRNKNKADQDAGGDSDETIPEEDDISELLNSHASSDVQLTADETTSRLSNHSELDHFESV